METVELEILMSFLHHITNPATLGVSSTTIHQEKHVTVGEEGSYKEVGRKTGKTIKSTVTMKG